MQDGVEARPAELVQDPLFEDGWNAGELWRLLQRDLTEPMVDPGVRIKLGPEQGGRGPTPVIVRQSEVRRRAVARDGGRIAAADVARAEGVQGEHRGHRNSKEISIATAAAVQELLGGLWTTGLALGIVDNGA